MLILFLIVPLQLFSQSSINKTFSLDHLKKKELLASKTISIADTLFSLNISALENKMKIFDIRNMSISTSDIRDRYIVASDSLTTILDSLKVLQKRILDFDKSKKTTLDSNNYKSDTSIYKKLKTDSTSLDLTLSKINHLNYAKIHYLILSNLNLTTVSTFAQNSIKELLTDSNFKNSSSYIQQSIGELLLASEIKTINDSAEEAGKFCINKYVAIYPAMELIGNQVHVNFIRKKTNMERRLKFRKKFYKKNLTEEIAKLPYTSNLLSTTGDTDNAKSALNAFFKKATISDIYRSTLLDTDEKQIISKYISNPKNLKKKKLNFGIKWTVNHRVKKLVQYVGFLSLRDTLVIDHIQVEIRESSIQNLTIKGHLRNNTSSSLVFDNRNIPFPLSSLIYLKGLKRSVPIQTRSVNIPSSSNYPTSRKYDMNLWEAIQYFPKFQPGSDNLAPEDGVFEIDVANTEGTCRTLHRTKTSKLFELKVFNDPLGFKSDVPNGLVQIEVNKRFSTVPRSTKLNGFTFVEPKFVWSKIEEKANLSISQTVDSASTQTAITAVDFVRYSKLQLDLKINGITLALPASSMIIYVNAGIGTYQTSLTDSIFTVTSNGDSLNPEFTQNIKEINTENVNTLNYYVDLDVRFRPDNRYNLLMNFKLGRLTPLNSKYEFKGIEEINHKVFNSYSVSLEASASFNGGRTFFRGIYTSNLEDSKNNFFQLQIGIAKTLFKTNND